MNEITERSLIELNMGKVCPELKTFADSKGIAFYEIGKERMVLKDKIDLINKISKENGYNETNSLLVELHFNKVEDTARSGTEIFYSQLETSEKGLQGEEFAARMLYEIKQLKPNGNFYAVKSDLQTRFKQLGILSNTKPLAVLVEYGFLSNATDLANAKAGNDDIAISIVN